MKKNLTGIFTALTAVVTLCTSIPMNVSAVDSCTVTNEEPEELVSIANSLNKFVCDSDYMDISAYVSLKWNSPSVELYVQNQQVYDDAEKFIAENGIERSKTDIILSPEYDFRTACGGQKYTDEINTIVADEYINIKNFMSDNNYLSNIFLTTNNEFTMIEVTVKEQETADRLVSYMDENYFWKDVVEIRVAQELTPFSENTVKNKSYVVLEGDVNDDGNFSVADVIKLQRYILGADSLNERQAVSSDILADSAVDVFDMVLARKKLIEKI